MTPVTPRRAALGAVGLGVLAVVAATAFGGNAGLIDQVVRPPNLVRAALVGISVVLCIAFLSRGLARLAAGADDVPGMVRGVRFVFLALASAAAAAGWALGDALPLVAALVIAGIDVIETSSLLLVVGRGQVDGRS